MLGARPKVTITLCQDLSVRQHEGQRHPPNDEIIQPSEQKHECWKDGGLSDGFWTAMQIIETKPRQLLRLSLDTKWRLRRKYLVAELIVFTKCIPFHFIMEIIRIEVFTQKKWPGSTLPAFLT